MIEARKNKFGHLPPLYNFTLNPYPDQRFSKCPTCNNKTGQRKLPLIIHIEPKHMLALNYTNRYCHSCDMLIGHKHEIEHILVEFFNTYDVSVIGNDYLIIGTVEKEAWREGMKQVKLVNEMLPYIHDFKSYQVLRMTMAGWFLKGQEPPERLPPPSKEWIK